MTRQCNLFARFLRLARPGLLLALLSTPTLNAAPLAVTDDTFVSLSQRGPLVAILSLGCDVGSYQAGMFVRANADVPGVQFGVIDYNAAHTIRSQIYELYAKSKINPGEDGITLGTLLLFKDGKVVSTSQMGYPGRAPSAYAFGRSDERRWLIHALESNGIAYRGEYRPPAEDRVAPDVESAASPEQLREGRVAEFRFSDTRDALGRQRDFQLAGTAKLERGALYLDGKYDAKTTAYFLYPNASDEPYKNGFTFSLNFRQLSHENGRGHVAILGYSLVNLSVWRGKLLLDIDPTYQLGEKGALGSYMFTIDDAPLKVGSWHTLTLSIDPTAKRARLVFDGRRLRDCVLDDRMLAELRVYKPGAVFHGGALGVEFSNFSGGGVLHGYADNVVIYDRPLSGDALLTLNRELADPSAPVVVPPTNVNQAKLDRALIRAARAGDAGGIQSALKAGANVEALYKGWSALHFAAYYGHEAAVRVLIANHADVLRKVEGQTAQNLARAQGHAAIDRLLEDYSNTPRFYEQRAFPLVQHRAMVAPPEPR